MVVSVAALLALAARVPMRALRLGRARRTACPAFTVVAVAMPRTGRSCWSGEDVADRMRGRIPSCLFQLIVPGGLMWIVDIMGNPAKTDHRLVRLDLGPRHLGSFT